MTKVADMRMKLEQKIDAIAQGLFPAGNADPNIDDLIDAVRAECAEEREPLEMLRAAYQTEVLAPAIGIREEPK